MKQININKTGDNSDPFYRYQMSQINLKHETNFTLITNIEVIANELKRDVNSIMKFLGSSFGTQSKFDKKRNCGSLQGPFTIEKIQSELQKYINEFVLCLQCGLPETTFEKKQKKLYSKCSACGKLSLVVGNQKVIQLLINLC